MGDTISRVHDNTSGTARGIEGENSLDGNIHGGHVEGLEYDLGHLLTVSLGVEGGLSEEDRLFLRGNTELIVEGVGENSLDGNIHGGHVEGLEHDLGHLLTVSLGVEG